MLLLYATAVDLHKYKIVQFEDNCIPGFFFLTSYTVLGLMSCVKFVYTSYGIVGVVYLNQVYYLCYLYVHL